MPVSMQAGELINDEIDLLLLAKRFPFDDE